MKTKLRFRRLAHAGFTMVELLTVIAIVVILVGLTIGIISIAQKKAAEEQCRAQMEMIKAGLARYYEEYNEFPEPTNNGGDGQDGHDGAAVLYQALTGDGDNLLGGDRESNGEIDEEEEDLPRFYNPEADNQKIIGKVGGQFVLRDPFGGAFQYVVFDKDNPNRTHNNTYDLWSWGDDKERTEETEAKWIKNW